MTEKKESLAIVALEMIAGERMCINNLLSDKMIARETLDLLRAQSSADDIGDADERVIDWSSVKPEAIKSDPLYQKGYADALAAAATQEPVALHKVVLEHIADLRACVPTLRQYPEMESTANEVIQAADELESALNAASAQREPAVLKEVRRIVSEYAEPNSHVDSGNLYWALCEVLKYVLPADAKATMKSTIELAKPAFSIERHGSGWAIYRGRDSFHHGYNLGHLTETNEATVQMLEDRLNAVPVDIPSPEPVGVVTCDAGGVWGLLSADLPIGAKLYREPFCCSKQDAAPQMWRVRMPYWQAPGIWNEMPANERARAEFDYWAEKAQAQGGVIEYAVVTERVAEPFVEACVKT